MKKQKEDSFSESQLRVDRGRPPSSVGSMLRRTPPRENGDLELAIPRDFAVARRTLGPVSDLERHLPAEWWKSLFNSIYLKTDGDVVENDQNTGIEVDQLVRVTQLQRDDRILDLCCGQGRHCIELARRGFANVVGVDRSRYLVRLARRRAKQLGLKISFHEGDARKFRLKEYNFRVVALMGNSFGYFDRQEDDLAVLSSVKRALQPGGTILLDVTDGDWMQQNYAPRSWEWIDETYFVCRERSLAADGQRLISREVVVHAERGVIVDQFYAERLYSPGTLTELLERAGYSHIEQHGTFEGGSNRQQDLGMMAHRLVVTARSPATVRPQAKRRPPFPKVTVMLGDHRFPDPCKRNGQFNPEDFETIRLLKEALGQNDQFEFDYVDDHEQLIDRLRNDPPGFVFNLCDEGFRNDPFKELHVPALLELFDVPYSGSGPAALGLCYNKTFVRCIAQAIDIPVPLETYIDPDDQSATIPSILPALLKPNFGDSSVGINVDSVVASPGQLVARIEAMRREFPSIGLLIQEFLAGEEYSVGVVGNPGQGYRFLPVLEVDYSGLDASLPKILGYESKWLPDSPYWSQLRYREATCDEETVRKLCDYSGRLFERLGCRDYARFDFRADGKGTIKLLEANPNPGWCWDGKLNLMAEFAHHSYADLLTMILEAAQARCAAAATPK